MTPPPTIVREQLLGQRKKKSIVRFGLDHPPTPHLVREHILCDVYKWSLILCLKNLKFPLKTRENLRFFGKCRKIWEFWIRILAKRFERYGLVSGVWFYYKTRIMFLKENLRFFGKFRKIWELWIRVLVERFESYELLSGVLFYFQKTSNFPLKLEKIWDFLENVERFESYGFEYWTKDLNVMDCYVEFDFIS